MNAPPILSDPYILEVLPVYDDTLIWVTNAEKFAIDCLIQGYDRKTREDGAKFDVTFLLDGVPNLDIPTFTTDATELKATLDESYLVGKIQRGVKVLLLYIKKVEF